MNIEKQKETFYNLIEQYKTAYKDVRLEYNLYRNTSNENIHKVLDIEEQLDNFFIDMINKVDVQDNTNDLLEHVSNQKQIHNNNKKKMFTNVGTLLAAKERYRIISFQLKKEKIFFYIYSLYIIIFLYMMHYLRNV